MTQSKHSKLLIIGSGPAGYTAAIYGARAMLSPILIEGIQPGGQLTITTDVENWPGDCSVQGPDLMVRMREHALAMGSEIISDHITALELSERPFLAVGDSGARYHGDALILATGAQARWLGLESEDYFKGFGVSACATCDGFFFRDKQVVVVGGGNTAVEEALFLTNFASKVTLVHRRDSLRAEKILQKRLFAHPKIEIVWNHKVKKIIGSENPRKVEGVILTNPETDAETKYSCSGVFIAIGHSPASVLVENKLEIRSGGYVVTKAGCTATSLEGVFVAGDLTDDVYRQAITSAGMGCMAALDAERFLAQSTVGTISAMVG